MNGMRRLQAWVLANVENRYVGNILSWFGLMYWNLDDKLPLREAIYKAWRRPLPGKVGWVHVFGGVSLFLVLLLVASGILLAFHYRPAPEAAYESVLYVMTDVPFGWLVRGVHHWAGELLLVLVLLHVLRVFFDRTFRNPRQSNWVLGVVVLPVVFAFHFTGTLLPWDQSSYWTSVRSAEVARSIPVLGAALAHVSGGSEFSSITLVRYFTSHVLILPWVLFFLLMVHLRLIRRDGITPPRRRARSRGDQALLLVLRSGIRSHEVESLESMLRDAGRTVERISGKEKLLLRVESADARTMQSLAVHPGVDELVHLSRDRGGDAFFPRHFFRIVSAMILTGGVLLLLSAYLPPVLGERHDPFRDPGGVDPSWYFLWFEEMRDLLPPALGFASILVIFATPLVALAWPVLDPVDDQGRPRRPWMTPAAGLAVLVLFGGLTLRRMLS